MSDIQVIEGGLLAGPRFGLAPFVSYTVSNFSGTAAEGYPLTYLYDGSQDASFRTTAVPAAGISFVLNFPAALATGGMLYIGLANFDKVYLQGRTVPGTPLYEWYRTISIYKDTRTDQRKMWYPLTGFTYQYLFIRMEGSDNGGTIDSPSTYFEIGEICVVDVSTVISFSLGHTLPIDYSIWRPREVLERRGGGIGGVNNFGRRRVRIDWANQPILISDEEKFLRIARMDEDQKFIFAENLSTPATPVRTDDRSRVYLVRRVGDSQITFAGEVLEVGLQMEEV